MDDVRKPNEPPGQLVRRLGGQYREVDHAARQRWLAENQAALDAFERWYKENGSPLDEHRQFKAPITN